MPPPGSPPPPDPNDACARFLALLRASLADSSFRKLVLAKPRSSATAQRLDVRRIQLREEAHLSFVYHHRTNDITKNRPVAEAIAEIAELVRTVFQNAHLFTYGEEVQLRWSKRCKAHLTTTRLQSPLDTGDAEHDRQKQRWIDVARPFLVELGVTTAHHQVVPAMAKKWRQIDKFVEVFAGALAASRLAQTKHLRIADFGAGKGYLTFALHDWLQQRGIEVQVTGVELRADLVQQGNERIARLGLQGLQFVVGDVQSRQLGELDVLIALHACDIATDHALHLGMRSGAEIILCSPCCHKELRPQLQSPPPLQSILQHGVHRAEAAEMLTDGLRAMLLEANGYATQVFEFVSLEHTQKNKMILAVNRGDNRPAAAILDEVQQLKSFYGIREQQLERLLAAQPVRQCR